MAMLFKGADLIFVEVEGGSGFIIMFLQMIIGIIDAGNLKFTLFRMISYITVFYLGFLSISLNNRC